MRRFTIVTHPTYEIFCGIVKFAHASDLSEISNFIVTVFTKLATFIALSHRPETRVLTMLYADLRYYWDIHILSSHMQSIALWHVRPAGW